MNQEISHSSNYKDFNPDNRRHKTVIELIEDHVLEMDQRWIDEEDVIRKLKGMPTKQEEDNDKEVDRINQIHELTGNDYSINTIRNLLKDGGRYFLQEERGKVVIERDPRGGNPAIVYSTSD